MIKWISIAVLILIAAPLVVVLHVRRLALKTRSETNDLKSSLRGKLLRMVVRYK